MAAKKTNSGVKRPGNWKPIIMPKPVTDADVLKAIANPKPQAPHKIDPGLTDLLSGN